MSGTDPGHPLVLLPGEVMDAFIGSIGQLAPADPVIIGGLAVMCRVGGEHRPTLDRHSRRRHPAGAHRRCARRFHDAVAEDLADLPAAVAVLQGSPVQAINEITGDLLDLVVTTLLDRLR